MTSAMSNHKLQAVLANAGKSSGAHEKSNSNDQNNTDNASETIGSERLHPA